MIGSLVPALRSVPPYADTFGPEAVELAASAGLLADPWQAPAVADILAIQPGGRWSAFEAGLIVPRQNGKGAVGEIVALAGMFLLGERLILWSAHEYKTAMEAFRRILDVVEGSDALRALVKRVSRTNGEESIELRTGQRLRFIARSKGSGRGFSADRLIVDETFAYTPEQQAATMPTMLARPNPQILYMSTPPLDSTTGLPLFGLRARARRGDDPTLCWLDWSLTEPDHASEAQRRAWLDNPGNWAQANPALGGRVSLEAVARLRASLDPDVFAREILSVWPPEPSAGAELSVEAWQALADPESRRHGPFAIALDVTPDRLYSTIAMAGVREDGSEHWEVIAHHAGTDWVVDRVCQLVARHDPVAVALDAKGPAGSLVVPLMDRGIKLPDDPEKPKAGQLAVPGYQEVAAACGSMIDAVAQGVGRHRDQSPLNVAVANARTRPLGDARAWARRSVSVPISPLVGLSLARWAYQTRASLVVRAYDPLLNIF